MKIVTVLERVPIMLPMEGPMEQGARSMGEINYVTGDWIEEPTDDAFQEAALAVEKKGANGMKIPQILKDNTDAEIMIGTFCPFSEAIMKKSKNLRIIGVARGGVENVDLEAATQNGIAVFNAAGRNANAVSDFTVGMILSEIRNIAKCHHQIKEGVAKLRFPNSDFTPDMKGKTLGLVGFGNIGRLVAKKMAGFEVNILTYDPFLTQETLEGTNVTLVEKEVLFRESDIVSIHARLTKDTMNLVGEEEISLMKPHSYFVNTARAGLVDYQALYAALAAKKIAGAALDVYDVEPLPADSPWMQLDNVTLTSHLGGATYDAQANSPLIVYEKIKSFIKDGDTRHILNKKVLEDERLKKWADEMKAKM